MDEGDEQWSLSRFAPLMQEVLEDLAANKLNFDEYPYVQPPSNDSGDCCSTLMIKSLTWTSWVMHIASVLLVSTCRIIHCKLAD